MTAIYNQAANTGLSARQTDALRSGSAALRGLLLLGCLCSLLLTTLLVDPAPERLVDAGLDTLLRGMAVIKAGMVLIALAVLWWRFGKPIPSTTAAVYLVGTWLATAATVLIWNLSDIALAAGAFHLGEIAVLLVAWRDGLAIQSLRRPAGTLNAPR
ncbi:MAG: hypothetical protein ACT4PZ_22165 [Panacagrimonas sp.]